jgi:hypothetical protein
MEKWNLATPMRGNAELFAVFLCVLVGGVIEEATV